MATKASIDQVPDCKCVLVHGRHTHAPVPAHPPELRSSVFAEITDPSQSCAGVQIAPTSTNALGYDVCHLVTTRRIIIRYQSGHPVRSILNHCQIRFYEQASKMMPQIRMPQNEDLDKVLPPSPRSPHMYGSPEGMTYSPKMASPRAKTSPRTRMLKKWPRKDERRMLNVVYRVGNIEESIEYYQECLGMHILRKMDFPEDKYLTVFMGYGYEDNHLAVELTYSYGVTKYDIGNGLNYFGLTVPNVQATLDEIRKKGFPGPASTSVDLNGNVYAMLKDPTGYPFKLIQRAGMRERLWQISLKVGDIGAAILFYQDAFGMFLIERNDYPLKQKTYAYIAYNLDDTITTVIELEYDYGVIEYNHGNGYVQLAIGTDDVYKTANAVELQHGRTVRPPGPLPGIPTKMYACLDPDNWKIVFVDNWDFSREQEPSSFVPRVTTGTILERNCADRCPGFDPMFDKPPGGF